ncbi:MAG: hypothetical protein AABW50_03900 [Nanoarchaeota archaeon]
MANLEEGDLILCTVDRIVGTVVFVKIEDDGEGSIMTSEIAPGRIRNIRDYVVPKKKIVCKVLRVSGDRIDLSLRRVTQKEQKEVLESYKQEKSFISVVKSILGDKAESAILSIKNKTKLVDFLEEAKTNPEELEKIAGKEPAQKIISIIKTQKQKIFIIKRNFKLSTIKPDGIELIKKMLGDKEIEIKYISAGNYCIKSESTDPKKADNKIRETLDLIEKEAKKSGLDFSIKEK